MAGRPLRPATRRRLGRPLPYQLADGPRAPLQAAASLNTALRTAFRLRKTVPNALRDEATFDRNPQGGRGLMRY